MTTPTISNVSGTVATGQTLTIAGANLLDEDTTNWDPDLNPAKSIFTNAFATDGWDAGGLHSLDTSVYLLGTQSAKYSGTGAGQIQSVCSRSGLSNTTKQHFYRFYTRCNFSNLGDGSYSTTYHKLLAVYNPSVSTNLNWWNGQTGNPYTQIYLDVGGTTQTANLPGNATHEEDRWYCVELEMAGASPWTHRVWVDGSLILEANFSDSDASPWDSQWPFNITGEPNTNFGFEEWTDGWVVSDSRVYPASKVEIADGSTYATATKVYQAPTTISNTSDVVTCDLTGLGAGPYYLFVTNGRNETSAAYNLSGGGSSPLALFLG